MGSCALIGALFATRAADAKVVRVDIETRAPLTGDFGPAGAFELLTGHVYGELDPRDPHNAIITDLNLAPRNGRGMVEYAATFALAKPVDPAKASGVLIYDVPNRSNGKAQGDPAGHMHLVSGWQGDIAPKPGQQTATVPVPHQADGSPVTGKVLVRLTDMPLATRSLPLTGGAYVSVSRPVPMTLDPHQAQLVRKRSDTDVGAVIPAQDWAFADCETAPFPGRPDGGRLCLKQGFDPKFAYELTYVAKDPPVLGIGFAAVRDLDAFLRYAPGTDNPVAGQISHTVVIGVSQAGNFVRSFIHLGFNASEDGRIVFDGANPRIAARHTPLNFRFAVPGGAAGLYEPGSEGVLWWSPYADAVRGRSTASLLDRCLVSHTCPKIVETFGASELWGLRMSPNLVGTDAKADIPLPDNVRRYYFPGVTHDGGKGGFAVISRKEPGVGSCLLPANPNPSSDTSRALTAALIDWVTKDAPPPPSRYPRLAEGQLVPPTRAAMGFPEIPGEPVPDGKINPFLVYDFGPQFRDNDLSGVITRLPPVVRGPLPSLVAKVDADGNETTGVPSVQQLVPLGAYLGWNVQATGFHAGAGCGFQGGYIPFAVTRAERLALGDPRPSLEERYRNHAGFVARVRAAAGQLVEARFLLPQDADRIIAEAEASSVLSPPDQRTKRAR
jgi:hypothetical protein